NKQLEDLKTQLAAEVTEREKLAAAITKLQQTADLAAKDRDILAENNKQLEDLKTQLAAEVTEREKLAAAITKLQQTADLAAKD
ncbi:hypothetical protein NXY81_24300, partial [Escherichia coli]|nr:hypothetical protein [Escherichia coli]